MTTSKLLGAITVCLLLIHPLVAQELIFQSGFEPGTSIVDQGSQFADIVGTDNSVAAPHDWVTDLEDHPNVGDFRLQYQDLDDNQQGDRRAELVGDPTGSGQGQVLKYWIVDDHVTFGRGRIQTNNYGAPEGMKEYYQRAKLYLPSESFTPLIQNDDAFDFLTITEIWNNNNWNPAFGEPDAYPYRLKVNITKYPGAGQPLVLNATGEQQSRPCCWGEGDDKKWQAISTYSLPLDTWLDIEIYIKEGDATTGKFQLALTPEGGTKQMLVDVTGWTHHPDDPDPDGIRYSNPLKMYTNSASTIDKVVAAGDSLKYYWDDFELWNNKTIEGAAPGGVGPSCLPAIAWDVSPFTPQTGNFTAQWTMTPDGNFMNGVVGLSPSPAGAYGELAIIVRFNNQGFIDARNGGTYTATNAVPYAKDVVYQVRTEVDLNTNTYDVYVTPEGGQEQTVAENFAFRTEQASATELGYYNINTEECQLAVSDFAIFSSDGSEVPYAPTAAVKPVLENGGKVTANSDGTYTATFGYYNQNDMGVNIPVGENNRFFPTPQDRGQTTTFRRGRQREVFSVILQPGETAVWTLKGPDGRRRTSTATAPSASPIPTSPTNLTAANVTETTVDLSWTASIDDQGIVKYEVLKDTQWDQSVFGAPPSPQATVTGLTPGTTYLFYVKAFDADGNASSNSQSIMVTTAGGGAVDADPPSQPTDLVASNITSTSVDLNWTASTDNEGVVKYEVLKDTQWDQSVFGAPPSPSATVTGLIPGTTYIFYVAAFDANRNRSSNSQVVTVTTPSNATARGEVATTKDKPSSSEGMSEETVTVYPNPVEYGPFTVRMPTTEGTHLSLYDQQGHRILIRVEADAQHLTVSPLRELAGGLYLLRLRQADGTLVQKKLMVQ